MTNKERDKYMRKAIAGGVITAPADGGHDYVGQDGAAYWTCTCGAVMWLSGSRGPTPFTRCPLKDPVQTSMKRRS